VAERAAVIPLYAFLEGDTLGLVIFADENESVKDLARKVQRAAALRVKPTEDAHVYFKGARLDASLAVSTQIEVVPIIKET